jgi:tRNA nucleotidyltransferase (CCA-adding enzyme)
MSSPLEEVCAEVLKRVNPSESERKKVLSLAKKLVEKVREEAEEKAVETEVRVEGSMAKNTWLRDCPEIDVFMRVPTTMPREAFGTVCLEIAKKATEGCRQIERFAEHPYLEAVTDDDVWVNVVPCYRVKPGEWISATDRTPFHTDYVQPLLDEQKGGEVRLLKRFMKGVDVYGAEIKVGGFSGYLCELLVLNYGSFVEVLRAAADWKEKTVIDYEGHYERKDDAKKLFEEPFVMVDPVDKRRNVAAAVRKERLDEFIAASRAFLKTPDLKFFYPQQTEALEPAELVNRINARGSSIVFIGFKGGPAVPDVLWGQLYKSQRALRKLIQKYDFTVLRDTVWSNEKNLNIFIFEVENRFLSNMKRHIGPPLRKKRECEKFLRKHVGAESTVSGPRIDGGRWVVDVQRRYTDVVKLLNEELGNSGESVGLAEFVSKAVADSLEVIVNDEALKLYSVNPDFAKFLTEYLTGKPRWLT